MKNIILKNIISSLLVLFVGLSLAHAKQEVGEVQYVRGILTSKADSEQAKLIGKDEPLFNGDVLNTGSRGFAIIKFVDGTKMTLRPNTKFQINNVNVEKGKENAFFSLIRGGFRAITGAISKLSPKAFRVRTPVATIGIRGTEFDARLCDDDCDVENKKVKQKLIETSPVIGRIAVLKGSASSLNEAGKRHELSVGAAIYERDKIRTRMNSFAVIAFNDKTRITMSPNSIFKVQEQRFKPKEPAENNAFFSFIRGGLRLVTGLIGKLNRESFRIGTPTATIGIRGTGFDLVCEGSCVTDETTTFNPVDNTAIAKLMRFFLKPAFAANNNGMYAKVWNGTIELQFSSGTLLLENGKSAFLKNGFSTPIILPDIPVYLRKMGGAPRPDKVKVKDDLFGGIEQNSIKPGLYVNVRDGDVQIDDGNGNVVDLGKGESGMSSLGGRLSRLKFVPAFQKFDVTPNPAIFTPKMGNAMKLLGLKRTLKSKFECSIQ